MRTLVKKNPGLVLSYKTEQRDTEKVTERVGRRERESRQVEGKEKSTL